MQLQQPKPFPLRVREFSDYLDVFGAWCVLVRGAEALGSEKGAKDRPVRSFVCLFVNFIPTAMRSQGCFLHRYTASYLPTWDESTYLK